MSQKNTTTIQGKGGKKSYLTSSDPSGDEYDTEDQALYEQALNMKVDELRLDLIDLGFRGNISKMLKK